MILHRVVFQAKPGKAKEVIARMKEGTNLLSEEQIAAMQPRILTDISGPFDTVVLETTYDSLAALEKIRAALFAAMDESNEPSLQEELIVSGRNEYYTIET